MKKRILSALWLWLLTVPSIHAQMNLGDRTTVSFASVDEAREILTARDDFVQRMSPFDRAGRMKTDGNVSEEAYLRFVGNNVLAWNDSEKQLVVSAFDDLKTELEDLAWSFPKQVLLVKTTGNEEGGAAYTRANAVVFPQGVLAAPAASIEKLLCHELFHVMSRANPDLREKLYAAIGFVACNEVAFPPELKARKLTNPDAPKNGHCIRIQVEGQEQWAVPILFSSTAQYDMQRGGEFFHYLTFQFLLVQRDDETATATPIYAGQEPKLVDMADVSGFFEQTGRNTGYIIHPEEILADNFALLKLKAPDVPSPEIIKKMAEILKEMTPPKPATAAPTDTR